MTSGLHRGTYAMWPVLDLYNFSSCVYTVNSSSHRLVVVAAACAASAVIVAVLVL